MLFQSANLRVDADGSSFATIWLDVQGQRFNVLTPELIADLDVAFATIAANAAIKGLVIRGAKESGFLAGADIHGFTRISTAEEARAASARGQQLFRKLADLSQRIHTVALIEGPCLGGGLELALACTARLAVDRPDTQFGLPEVELGLLPAWGGTQRLPRLVGLENALKVLLTGKRLTSSEALAWGLVSQVLAVDEVSQAVEALASGAGSRPVPRPRTTFRRKLLESNPIGRWLILRGTARILRRRVPDDMPAPGEALRAVRVGLSRGQEAGLAQEREAVGRLATSAACRNLVGLFVQREAARKLHAEIEALAGPPVRRVGIVGAGAMGAGIAQLAAIKGCEVAVQEVNETALRAGLLKVAALFKKAVANKVLSHAEAEQRLAKVRGTNTWKGFSDVDLVVEAIVEDLAIKQSVFRELEKHVPAHTVLATNTSSLSVARVQEDLANPERVAGLHFFNPVHKMPLVEVIETPRTEPRVVALLRQWSITLGKTPVVVKDSPGFVVNRVLIPYLCEAIILLTQKLSADRVDKLLRRFGMPMGPLELLDQIGVDVAVQVTRAAQPVESAGMAGYAAAVGFLLQEMCQRGWLGQKSGMGFYRYRGRRRRPNRILDGLFHKADLRGRGLDTSTWAIPQPGETRDRLILPMVNAAAACVGEKLTARAEEIDLAMVLGAGWAPHRGGPLHYGDERGLPEVVRVLEGLARRLGPWFEPCAELRCRAELKQPFCTAQPD